VAVGEATDVRVGMGVLVGDGVPVGESVEVEVEGNVAVTAVCSGLVVCGEQALIHVSKATTGKSFPKRFISAPPGWS
jgi:hypothetical protein